MNQRYHLRLLAQDWYMMQYGIINMMIYRRADSSALRRVPIYIRFIHAICQDVLDTTRTKEYTLDNSQAEMLSYSTASCKAPADNHPDPQGSLPRYSSKDSSPRLASLLH